MSVIKEMTLYSKVRNDFYYFVKFDFEILNNQDFNIIIKNTNINTLNKNNVYKKINPFLCSNFCKILDSEEREKLKKYCYEVLSELFFNETCVLLSDLTIKD